MVNSYFLYPVTMIKIAQTMSAYYMPGTILNILYIITINYNHPEITKRYIHFVK